MIKLFVPLAALVLLGAGCLGLGGDPKTTDGGVWKSTDAGLNWVQSVALPTANGVGSIATTNIVDLVFDPQDHLAIYIGTGNNGLLFSYDGGVSWQQPREPSLRKGYIQKVAVDPLDKCTIYVLLSTQLTKSEDCGRTFDMEVYVEGRTNVSITALSVDWFNPLVIWLGTSEGDILKSEDGGVNWNTVYRASSQIDQLLVDANDSRIVLATTVRRGIRKTSDAGQSWVDTQETLEDFDAKANRINYITQDATGSIYLLSTDYAMFRSMDKGDTWQEMDLLTDAAEIDIPVVAIDPNDANRIYYATQGTFYSSIDGGANWQTRKAPTSREPSNLLVDPVDGNLIYLGGIYYE